MGVAFHNHALAVVVQEQVVIVAGRDDVSSTVTRQRKIFGERRVSKSDHQISTSFNQLGAHGLTGCDGVFKGPVARRGLFVGVIRGQAINTNLHRTQIDNHVLLRKTRNFASAVADVGRYDREGCFGHPLFKNVGAKVEFVVARRKGVDAQIVHQINDVSAFVQRGQNGRGNDVTSMQQQAVFSPSACLSNCSSDTRESIFAVNIIQQDDAKVCGFSRCSCCRQQRAYTSEQYFFHEIVSS